MDSLSSPPLESAEPWRRDSAEVAAELDVDIRVGLTSAEAAARLVRYGPNQVNAADALPAWRKLLAQFADPLIYLLIAAVVAMRGLGEHRLVGG
jgi:magnesium-transporting ATPase (P-type)